MDIRIPFQKQAIMRQVVMALTPALIGSIYFFGWISFLIVGLSVTTCVLTEWLFIRKKGGKTTEAALVTGMLLGLVLPPTVPLPMVVLGAVFAVTFGKMAFGGFGANSFNPAMVGRAFLYITFPIHMTARWIPAADFSAFPGGFAAFRYFAAPSYTDAVTTATFSHAYKAGAQSLPSLSQLLLGNINGSFENLGTTMLIGGGSLGETSVLLLSLGGIYLLIKKTAKWRIVASFFGTYALTQVILHHTVPHAAPSLVMGMVSGGAVLGGFFMVTDPVSGAKTRTGQLIYGAFIAICTNIIRTFSLFAGGLMFSILLGNMFAPLFDLGARAWEGRRKAE